MDVTTNLEELAQVSTKVFLDANVLCNDYNYSDFQGDPPSFSDHIGARSLVKIRCGGSLGYRGISDSHLLRQAKHIKALAPIVRDNPHLITTTGIVDEHLLLVDHLYEVLRKHSKGKQGRKEKTLRECADQHAEINNLLRARAYNANWPELMDYVREKRLFAPRRNLFKKKKRAQYSPEDASLVVGALMECFDTDARVAIVTQDFDIINIALHLGEDIHGGRLPTSLAFLHGTPLGRISTYFPSNERWTQGYEVDFMADTKLNFRYKAPHERVSEIRKLII